MRVQAGLHLGVHIRRGVIHKDASTLVLRICLLFPIGMKQSPEWIAHEVIDGNLTAREQLVLLQRIHFLGNRFLDGSGSGFTSLLCKLTGCTEGSMSEFCSSGLKTPGTLTRG